MSIGQMKKRVTFHRPLAADDGYGNPTSGFDPTPYLSVRGHWRPERGREALAAGRLESVVAGVLRVRGSSASAAITTADRATFDGEDYQIRAITNPDQRGRWYELRIERGAAV